jgi:hypothetical protein
MSVEMYSNPDLRNEVGALESDVSRPFFEKEKKISQLS